MVTIRLARHGGKKRPFYHVTVAERAAKRDGRFIERIGFYNPVARGREEELRIDLDRVDYWLASGAQPTDRVKQLLSRWRKSVAEQAMAQAAADAEAAAEASAAEESETAGIEPDAGQAEPADDVESSSEPG